MVRSRHHLKLYEEHGERPGIDRSVIVVTNESTIRNDNDGKKGDRGRTEALKVSLENDWMSIDKILRSNLQSGYRRLSHRSAWSVSLCLDMVYR